MPKTIVYSDSSKSKSPDGIRHITSDDEFNAQIKTIGPDHLLVLYFSLPWCGSCQKINPAVEALSSKYTEATFLQVNADKCTASTKKHHVTKVPVFLLFNNRIKLDRVEGASPSELESKIRRNLAEIHFQAQGLIPQPKHLASVAHQVKMSDITQFLDKTQCRCVNDLAPTSFQGFLDGKKLLSGRGVGRMILVYAFKEKMVISGLKIKAPVHSAPKVLRFFVNLHKIMDFAAISQMSSTQEITLTAENLSGEHTVDLKAGGLVGVKNLQIYIPETMTKNRRTEIDSLILMGSPVALTSYATAEVSEFIMKPGNYEDHHEDLYVPDDDSFGDDESIATALQPGPSSKKVEHHHPVSSHDDDADADDD